MIKLEHVVLASPEQMEFIIEGMRNPMNSWEKKDSREGCEQGLCWKTCKFSPHWCGSTPRYIVGENDHSLMQRLSNAGTDHRKFMRMMPVYVRIRRLYIGGKNLIHTKLERSLTAVVRCTRSRRKSLHWKIFRWNI